MLLHYVFDDGDWKWIECTIGHDLDANTITGHVTVPGWFVLVARTSNRLDIYLPIAARHHPVDVIEVPDAAP